MQWAGEACGLAGGVARRAPLGFYRRRHYQGMRVNQGMHQQVQKQERRYYGLRFQGRCLSQARQQWCFDSRRM